MINREIDFGMSVIISPEFENNHFSCIFIDISLTITLTYLKIDTHFANTHWEGIVSQNSDIVFSFNFMLCRRLGF